MLSPPPPDPLGLKKRHRIGFAFAVLLIGGGILSVMLASDRRVEERQHARLLEVRDAPLTPFVSDGCSGGLSRIWNEVGADPLPFESCCVSHDRAYHAGGSAMTARGSYVERLAADRAFQMCVAETGGEVVSDALFQAVRLGGVPCSGLSWRWGYGRPRCQ
ncbi:MAG: hypothetical protein AAGK92_07815 [Pseudomonadota bacterium]